MKKPKISPDCQIVDVFDVLTDPENTAPIIMYNDKGDECEFDQIAVIPMDDGLYCILKPIDFIEGIKENEAVVFEVMCDEPAWLKVVEEEEKACKVFDKYLALLEEQNDD